MLRNAKFNLEIAHGTANCAERDSIKSYIIQPITIGVAKKCAIHAKFYQGFSLVSGHKNKNAPTIGAK